MGDAKYCPNCGEATGGEVPQTTNNQKQIDATIQRNQKNEVLALILSFIIPGVGEIYTGKVGKGLALLLLAIIAACLILFVVGFIMYPIVWIYSMVDSYKLAKEYNYYLAMNDGNAPW